MPLSKAQKKKIEEEVKYRQAVSASISSSKTIQKHSVPLLLSVFFPGLGQLVKGQIRKGLLIFFAPILGFITVALLSSSSHGAGVLVNFGQLWIGSIILYIWQLIDAYNN